MTPLFKKVYPTATVHVLSVVVKKVTARKNPSFKEDFF